MSSKNDSAAPLESAKFSAILLDVAGTTTSINFVKETLFPFVVKNAEEFLKSQWEVAEVKEAVKLLQEDTELDLAAAVTAVKTLTESENDNKGLKTIQGLIYKGGYEKGDLKAHVFKDVPAAFETWSKTYKIAIYSTGSVESQTLLFTHTVEGDLSKHVARYFDQTVGAKTDPESYKKISEKLEVKPEEIVFFTDNLEEAKAANTAALSAFLVSREGNAALPDDVGDFKIVSTFTDVSFDKSNKRKSPSEESKSEEPPSKVLKTDVVEEKSSVDCKKDEEKKEETPAALIEDEPMEVDIESTEIDASVKKENSSEIPIPIPKEKDSESAVSNEVKEKVDKPEVSEKKTEEKKEEKVEKNGEVDSSQTENGKPNDIQPKVDTSTVAAGEETVSVSKEKELKAEKAPEEKNSVTNEKEEKAEGDKIDTNGKEKESESVNSKEAPVEEKMETDTTKTNAVDKVDETISSSKTETKTETKVEVKSTKESEKKREEIKVEETKGDIDVMEVDGEKVDVEKKASTDTEVGKIESTSTNANTNNEKDKIEKTDKQEEEAVKVDEPKTDKKAEEVGKVETKIDKEVAKIEDSNTKQVEEASVKGESGDSKPDSSEENATKESETQTKSLELTDGETQTASVSRVTKDGETQTVGKKAPCQCDSDDPSEENNDKGESSKTETGANAASSDAVDSKVEPEEKENHSELANGVEKESEEPLANGKDVENSADEAKEIEVVDKIKKMEGENEASSSVSLVA